MWRGNHGLQFVGSLHDKNSQIEVDQDGKFGEGGIKVQKLLMWFLLFNSPHEKSQARRKTQEFVKKTKGERNDWSQVPMRVLLFLIRNVGTHGQP